VHVNLDAWSVNTTSSGSVKLYIRRVANVAELRRVLAEAGVPAVVYTDESCWNPDQIRNSAWSGPPAVDRGGLYLTIHPAAIPAGAEVEIVLHFFHGRVNGGGMGLAWRSHVRACPVTQSPSGS
jgi:hypothetical protein